MREAARISPQALCPNRRAGILDSEDLIDESLLLRIGRLLGLKLSYYQMQRPYFREKALMAIWGLAGPLGLYSVRDGVTTNSSCGFIITGCDIHEVFVRDIENSDFKEVK